MVRVLTCTMLQAAYKLDRDQVGKTAPDLKEFQIIGPGKKQLKMFGGYMYEQMTLQIAMYLRTFLINKILTLPGWAGFMEQGHGNQAWASQAMMWKPNSVPYHPFKDWVGGVDRIVAMLT
eukprot:4530773-Heterocapsa_arctica.AAC.1